MIEKQISVFIENQFPALYREDAEEFISLVKAYFEFLEQNEKQSLYHSRRIFDYNDIDLVTLRFLLSYRNKFLKDVPFNDETIRFVIKHILDLYRRKGSKEGIELFFRLFYDEDVEIYYPSEAMLKPSDSIWKISRYLELYPTDISNLEILSENDDSCEVLQTVVDNIIGKKIRGTISKSEAFVDSAYFVRNNQQRSPLLFISSIKGQFVADDILFDVDSEKIYGKVYGSLTEVIDIVDSTANNQIGDLVAIQSTKTGAGAKGIVRRVTEDFSGSVDFSIIDGGFGYTLTSELVLSDQVLFTAEPTTGFRKNERIIQSSSNAEAIITGIKDSRIGVRLSDPDFPFVIGANTAFNQIETVDRSENISATIAFVSDVNRTAAAQIGFLENVEQVTLIVDIIEDFKNVQLNASNYSDIPPATASMSGTPPINLSTKLEDAFVPQTFSIGSIGGFTNINPGEDYESDIFVLGRNSLIAKFDKRDLIVTIGTTSESILIGDRIEQTVTGAKGIVVDRRGNDLYVRMLSFASFIVAPIFKTSNPSVLITVNLVRKDFNSIPMGLNANIEGIVSRDIGKILELQVTDSGIGYQHFTTAELQNLSKKQRQIDLIQAELSKYTEDDQIISWNLYAIALGILKAVNQETAEKLLFADTIIPSTLTPVGNITQSGTLSSIDGLEMLNYANTRQSIYASYIEEVMLPYMELNASVYLDDYGTTLESKQVLEDELKKLIRRIEVDARATALVRRQGFSEGRWESKTSHLNVADGKVLQDSFYFQDYSYEIGSSVSTNKYEETLKRIVHPAGIKYFSTFSKIDLNDLDIEVITEATKIISTDVLILNENEQNVLVTEAGNYYTIPVITE